MTRQGGRRSGRTAVVLAVAVGVLVGSIVACDQRAPDATTTGPGADAHDATPSTSPPSDELVQALTKARLATVKYATDLPAAQHDGYKVITTMMAGMGVHYLNPEIKGFDLAKPPILVYVGKGAAMQLVALEWVFPEEPETPPLPGATYGSFDAACHYVDGEFIAGDESSCGTNHPMTSAPFFFWHPKLVTLHVWLWYPNPAGIYHGTNPLISPYDIGAQPRWGARGVGPPGHTPRTEAARRNVAL